jgi:hypothetical protein
MIHIAGKSIGARYKNYDPIDVPSVVARRANSFDVDVDVDVGVARMGIMLSPLPRVRFAAKRCCKQTHMRFFLPGS